MCACSDPRAADIQRVLDAYDEAAAGIAWPGFDPRSVPLALYDDAHTYLLRHPSPPDGARRVRGVDDAVEVDPLADARANTDIEVAGVRVAVAAFPDPAPDPVVTASLAMHEAFHAYQTERLPAWTANEVDLFTYPVRSAAILELRRLEGGALRRSVTAPDSVRELCWAREFLRLRSERFARLDDAATAYERHSELREGLARYVEARAAGRAEVELPGDGFPPERIRDRAYDTGHALSVLLDRMVPSWKDSLIAAGPEASLDVALAAGIAGRGGRVCRAAPDEAARTRAVARSDSAELGRRLARARAAFDEAPGWRVEVVAAAGPLSPERFDPLNVQVLDERHVLHSRWLRLVGPGVRAEVLDHVALTHGLEGHPLFAGVDRLWITGLREPSVEERGDTIRIRADGVDVSVIGGTLERAGQRLSLRAGGEGS